MKRPLRLLIVEDSEDDAEMLVRELSSGSYQISFERVDSHPAMMQAITDHHWDIVICDYSMPHFSGSEALELLRKRNLDIPFIFVSGTIGEDTAVAALKQGAQDYVMKGNLKRLLPTVERELKEAERRREKVRLERQVRQLERFEAIGRLAGGIAHDFNNIIAAVMGWSELGEEKAGNERVLADYFQKIRKETERAAGLTGQLLAFARRQLLQPQTINLNESIWEMGSFLQSTTGGKIKLRTTLEPQLRLIQADPIQIGQVIMNLCINAKDAMPDGGQLIIKTQNAEIDDEFCRRHSCGQPGAYALLVISDSGIGMDPVTMERIFEPFFTTKALGKGTGLGLATVYGIVKQHEGFINVDSAPGKGTSFYVYFPAKGEASTQRAPKNQGQICMSGYETVLVAEDNEAVRRLAYEVLSSQGYTTILARDGEEAVRLFADNSDTIQLLILDVMMPLLGGPDAYNKISDIRADMPVIFMTGHTNAAARLHSLIDSGAVLLEKPFALQKFSYTVRTTLDRYQSRLNPFARRVATA